MEIFSSTGGYLQLTDTAPPPRFIVLPKKNQTLNPATEIPTLPPKKLRKLVEIPRFLPAIFSSQNFLPKNPYLKTPGSTSRKVKNATFCVSGKHPKHLTKVPVLPAIIFLPFYIGHFCAHFWGLFHFIKKIKAKRALSLGKTDLMWYNLITKSNRERRINDMNTAMILDNVIPFPKAHAPRRSTNIYKSDGNPKATAADPVRSLEDIERIKEYFLSKRQIRNYTIFVMGITFGIRAGDLLDLKIHHILNKDGTFKRRCTLIESKTRKTNMPNINKTMRKILNDYLATLHNYSYDDPLFQSRKTDLFGRPQPLSLRQLNYVLAKAEKDLELDFHFSSHSLRKTFAYHLLMQNQNDDVAKFALQKMLNHNDFKTTLTYSGLQADAMDKYRDALTDVLLNNNTKEELDDTENDNIQ